MDPSFRPRPRISVLVPAYNEELLIAQTIGAIRQSFESIDYDAYEIIICDNNSSDRTSVVAQQHGARIVFEPHNQIARARNTAAKHAMGEWLIFIDADTSLNATLLRETVSCFESGSVFGGGSVIAFDRSDLGRFASGIVQAWNRISSALQVAAGSYIFCYKQAWEEVGGFDERVYAGEELFFSRKLKQWGRKHGLRFRVLTKSPIVTSARKMEWYNPRQLLWHIVLMARPSAYRNRAMCDLWYSRPKA